uniref:Uncharacterized protein n=1 Tax=Chrysemys picta bellii TaxID=8478 RepID=A0A8C3FUE6_CHRPI
KCFAQPKSRAAAPCTRDERPAGFAGGFQARLRSVWAQELVPSLGPRSLEPVACLCVCVCVFFSPSGCVFYCNALGI